ncbi:MAG: hypothetical protein AAGF60_07400 [Pseudomonadota bacterium]
MGGLLWLLLTAALVVPFYKLLPHFGLNQWWCLVAIIPIGAIALLWIMAVRLNDMERR